MSEDSIVKMEDGDRMLTFLVCSSVGFNEAM